MKKIFVLFSLLVLSSSCSLPYYQFNNKYNAVSIDLNSGSWLLNTVDIPYSISNQLEQSFINEFSNILEERFCYYPNTSSVMIPRNISMNPTISQLKEIKQLSGFDFFINVKGGVLREDLGVISGSKLANAKENNSSYVELEIYDLNKEIIIYSQKVTGTTTRTKDNHDVHFSKTSNDLLKKCSEKLLTDLRSKMILK